MSNECQAGIRYDKQLRGRCPRPALDTLELICMHEHITTARLCEEHVAAIEIAAQCPTCASKAAVGDSYFHRGCRVRVLAGVPVVYRSSE